MWNIFVRNFVRLFYNVNGGCKVDIFILLVISYVLEDVIY